MWRTQLVLYMYIELLCNFWVCLFATCAEARKRTLESDGQPHASLCTWQSLATHINVSSSSQPTIVLFVCLSGWIDGWMEAAASYMYMHVLAP